MQNNIREVVVADVLGFCSGVRRAITIALKAGSDYPAKAIYTFGQLIHNNDAISFLEKQGITALPKETLCAAQPGQFKDAVLILCAHGVERDLQQRLETSFYKVIDATCPHVLQNQKKCQAESFTHKTIILAGEKEHQEILSLKTHIEPPCRCIVVQKAAEAESLLLTPADLPLCFIAQTTLKQSEYRQITQIISSRISTNQPDIKVLNTICPATQQRQDALIKLSKNCDAIIVIGGKNSANSVRLFQTAKALQPHSYLIENKMELPPEIFSVERIGITAGASTPDFVIADVKDALMQKT